MLKARLILATMIMMTFNPSVVAQEPNPLAYFESIPDKWRSEAISFPLEFAPSLEYQGNLELLFSPGMFDEKSEEFLSYGFVWAISGTDIPTTEQLARDLKTYYYGLQSNVSENTLTAKTRSQVWLSEQNSEKLISYDGKVEWTEPFVTQLPQTLNLNVTFYINEELNQWFGFFRVSPQNASHPLWKALAELPINTDIMHP